MKMKILPSKLKGEIDAPPSKSYTHRALLLAALADGTSRIQNPLLSDDTRSTMEALQMLGVSVTGGKNSVTIRGMNGKFIPAGQPATINCGLSGTTMRLMTAVASLAQGKKIVIDGEEKLRSRPINDLVTALKTCGIDIKSANGDNHLPVVISDGKFTGGEVKIAGHISSQFVSALLLISPFATRDTTITVSNLKSAPYVDITVDLMKTFGVNTGVTGNSYFVRSNQSYKACNYKVEGDYSSASYFLAANFLTGSKIAVNNLNPSSVQGDMYFLKILEMLRGSKNRVIDMGNSPDIVPTVAIVVAAIAGETEIVNIGHLRAKESDRIQSVCSQLSKMTVKVSSTKDSLHITGGKLQGAQIDTFNDHRIAMSFAVAALAAEGETIINNAEVVNKSYPDFWKDLKSVGAEIKIII